jgi:release factor glutamine methyltransferase
VTRAEALADVRRVLAEAGLDTPALDARLLVAAALGIAPVELALGPGEPLSAAQAQILAGYARRRVAREPVARILGEWEFWGLPFSLSPETLVPRPETETVVARALHHRPDRAAPLKVLDLGTGTGCLLIALLHERPRAVGLGIDRSTGALATARRNALRNGVEHRAVFAASDWGQAVQGPFDLIVSNPPYVVTPVIATLAPDVREHDPMLALDGGPDGLSAYRIILAQAPGLLAPNGLVVLEIGHDQAEALRALAAGGPLEILEIAHDLSGSARCVTLVRR